MNIEQDQRQQYIGVNYVYNFNPQEQDIYKDQQKSSKIILKNIDILYHQNNLIGCKQQFDQYFRLRTNMIIRKYTNGYNVISETEVSYNNTPFANIRNLTDNQIIQLNFRTLKQVRLEQPFNYQGIEKRPFLQPNQISNIIQPSLKHELLQLLRLKINYYQKLGYGAQVERIQNSLTFNTNSEFFPLLTNCYSIIQQAFRIKNNTNINDAITYLKQKIHQIQQNFDKSILFRKLARYLKHVDCIETLQAYDNAIKYSEFDKAQIYQQRNQYIQIILKKNHANLNIQGILLYFDNKILQSSQDTKYKIWIQKAQFLTKIGQVENSIQTYNMAIQQNLNFLNNVEVQYYRFQLLKQKSFFLRKIGKYQQSIQCFKNALLNNFSSFTCSLYGKFLKKILSIQNLNHSIKEIALEQRCLNFYSPYDRNQKRVLQRANKQFKINNFNNAINILREGIQQSIDQQQKSVFYRKLAKYFSLKQHDAKQTLKAYDNAIKYSEFDKVIISRERMQTIQNIINLNNAQNYNNIISYYTQKASNLRGREELQILIEKAQFFYKIGQINQTALLINTVYNKKISLLNRRNINYLSDRYNLLKQKSIFLKLIGQYQQSIQCFELAIQVYPSSFHYYQYGKFLNKMLDIQNLNQQTRQFVLNKYKNQTVYYIYQSNQKKVLQRAHKQFKSDNYKNALRILKEGIQQSNDSQQKSMFYQKVAQYLKKNDQQGINTMKAFNKAIELTEFDKVKIYQQKIQTLLQFCKNPLKNKDTLINYFFQRKFDYLDKHQDQFWIQYLLILENSKKYSQAITIYTEIFNQQNQISIKLEREGRLSQAFFNKKNSSKNLINKAYLLQKIGQYQQALNCLDQSIKLYDGNQLQKLRFIWKFQSFSGVSQINQLIKKSKNKVILLRQKARLYQTAGKRQINQMRKNKILKESITIYNQVLTHLSDYQSIKNIFIEQKYSYQLLNMSQEQIMNRVNKSLQEIKLYQDYVFAQSLQNKEIQNYFNKKPQDYRNKQKRKKYFQEIIKIKQNFSMRLLIQQSLSCHFYFSMQNIDYIARGLMQQYWLDKKYKNAFIVLTNFTFVNSKNIYIYTEDDFSILSRCYDILNLFKKENYNDAIIMYEWIQNSQSLLNFSLYKANDLAVIMNKIYILSLWHNGKYQLSSKLCTDLVFTSGNFIQYITPQLANKQHNLIHSQTNIILSLDEYETYQPMVKYNSLKYSEKKGKYKDCLRKAQQLQFYLKGEIKDPLFHVDYVKYLYLIAQDLKNQNNNNYIDSYCIFMSKYTKNNLKEKSTDVDRFYNNAHTIIKKLFQQKIKTVEDNIGKFRDIYTRNGDISNLQYQVLKNYIVNVQNNLALCIKIINYQVLNDIQKGNTVKTNWQNICNIIYKDILKIDIDFCYDNIKETIQNVRNTLKQKVMICKDKISYQSVSQLRNYYAQQIAAIVHGRLEPSVEQIKNAYLNMKEQLLRIRQISQKNEQNNKIIKQLVINSEDQNNLNEFLKQKITQIQDNIKQSNEKQQKTLKNKIIDKIIEKIQIQQQKNQFYNDMIMQLKQSLNQKKVKQLTQLTYQQMQVVLQQVYNFIKNQLQQRQQKNMEKIEKLCMVVKQQIDVVINRNQEYFQKDQIVQQIKDKQKQNQNTVVSKFLIDQMNKVLQKAQKMTNNYDFLQQTIKNLQNTIKNRGNIEQLNISLTNISAKIIKQNNQQTVSKLQQLIKRTSNQTYEKTQISLDGINQLLNERINQIINNQIPAENIDHLQTQIDRINRQMFQMQKLYEQQLRAMQRQISRMKLGSNTVDNIDDEQEKNYYKKQTNFNRQLTPNLDLIKNHQFDEVLPIKNPKYQRKQNYSNTLNNKNSTDVTPKITLNGQKSIFKDEDKEFQMIQMLQNHKKKQQQKETIKYLPINSSRKKLISRTNNNSRLIKIDNWNSSSNLQQQQKYKNKINPQIVNQLFNKQQKRKILNQKLFQKRTQTSNIRQQNKNKNKQISIYQLDQDNKQYQKLNNIAKNLKIDERPKSSFRRRPVSSRNKKAQLNSQLNQNFIKSDLINNNQSKQKNLNQFINKKIQTKK